MFVTAAMVAGLLLGLRGATTDLNPVNLGRLAILVLLLATVPLDNLVLLRTPRPLAGHPIEAELRSMADSDQGAEPVAPASVVAALRDLEALVNGLPTKEPAPVPAHEDFVETELRSLADRKKNAEALTPAAVTEAFKELESLVDEPSADEPTVTPAPEKPSTGPADDDYLRRLLATVLGESDAAERRPRSGNSRSSEGEIVLPSEREGLTDELSGQEPAFRSDRVPWLGRYFRRSTEALLADARNLINGGDLDKARKRLDRVVAKGVQNPGLWDLAAALYDRLGESQKASECRRRARRFSR
jgi:tetratricopeptide (TPR) repeat protein